MNLNLIFKDFKQNPLRAFTKICFLGIGFAIVIVLITKIFLEQSYDTFYPDNERIYRLEMKYVNNTDGEIFSYPNISGGIAPYIAKSIPSVEVATRNTSWGVHKITTKENNKLGGMNVCLVDENHFDVFSLPVIEGDPKDVLSRPNYAMVSASVAEKLGGNVVGKQFSIVSSPNDWYVIGGVFEDIPVNTHRKYDILISFFRMDGKGEQDRFVGRAYYSSYFKLKENVDLNTFKELSNKTISEHPIMKEEKIKASLTRFYEYVPIAEIYNQYPYVKQMILFLAVIAILVLFPVVINYVLLLFSNIATRSKKIAICKCYGASRSNIISYILLETLIYVVLSIFLALLILLSARDLIENSLAIPFESIFNLYSLLFLVLIFSLIVFFTGYLPGRVFAKIPVQRAFINFKLRYRWKRYFLSFQFCITVLIMTLLAVVNLQYNRMINDDPGYEYKNLAYVYARSNNPDVVPAVIEDIKRLPEVDMATISNTLPFRGYSGGSVRLPNSDPNINALFNIGIQGLVGPGYVELIELPIIEGSNFNEALNPSNEIMVSRTFAEALLKHVDWPDGVVGKEVDVNGRLFKICGVYENYKRGSILYQDNRPSILGYGSFSQSYGIHMMYVVKFHEINQKSMDAVSAILKKHTNRELETESVKNTIVSTYRASKGQRDIIVVVSLIALFISLFGLIVYLQDEINYRRFEFAMRKINGAKIKDIILLFIKDIMFLFLPSCIIGGAIAYYISIEWLKQFSEKVSIIWVFPTVCLVLASIIIGFILLICYKISKENPSKSLRSN